MKSSGSIRKRKHPVKCWVEEEKPPKEIEKHQEIFLLKQNSRTLFSWKAFPERIGFT